ncbi:hypothetical protein [Mycoplasma sp. ATU-Cv-703]|uniref:hypothetical protein n=1 Tax=Mycoplasma sp. ATU-Cv-703 TaxID=2498595 RepID=UPI000FDF5E25
MKEKVLSRKSKIYATFQFVTFISYFVMGMTFLLILTLPGELLVGGTTDISVSEMRYGWIELLKEIFTFRVSNPGGLTVSILVYLSFGLVLSSWVIGLQIVRTSERGLFDQLFLLFVFVPLLSNVLCLLAQFSSETLEISYTVTKEERQKEFDQYYDAVSRQKEREIKDLRKRLYNLKKH